MYRDDETIVTNNYQWASIFVLAEFHTLIDRVNICAARFVDSIVSFSVDSVVVEQFHQGRDRSLSLTIDDDHEWNYSSASIDLTMFYVIDVYH
jgi:hypothetical protein